MATAIAPTQGRTIDPDDIAEEIATTGYARLPGVFDGTDIAEAEAQVRAAIARAGGRCCFPQRDEVTGPILSGLYDQPWFRTVMERAYARLTGRAAPGQSPTQTLRCLTGADSDQHAWYFHWDTWIITAIIPIVVPQDSASGQLMLLPNTRPVRKSYARNVLDKFLIGTRRAQRRLRRQAARCTALTLEPGSIYLFSGYRTLHANATIAPEDTRVTLVLHFGDPYNPEDRRTIDRARRLVHDARSWRRRRKTKA